MKKMILLLMILSITLILSACNGTEKVEIPDLIGMDYGDVIKWATENDIDLVPSSDYNDDVVPNSVFYQSVDAGVKVAIDSEIEIIYSRGFDPEGIIVVPDFSGKTKEDIETWLSENDIGKFNFKDTFDLSVEAEQFSKYDVQKNDDRSENYRKDTYNFYFSKGELTVEDIEFDVRGTVRGVNLGGWFVLEGWMTPDLFEGVSGSDETAFMEQKPDAVNALEDHWDTFITEDDFIWLEDHNVEFVRLPIPWWLFGGSYQFTQDGEEHDVTYASAIYYIDRAMMWAEEHNIKVLLDLHTAPGCQNGFDNGGIAGLLEWEQTENVAATVEVISEIAEHFSPSPALWGIEVLNEPGWGVNMGILQDYYVDAYDAIREHNNTVWVGFHDGFRGYMEGTWTEFFENNDFNNVFFDIHLYQIFGDMWGDFDIYDHIDWVHVEQQKAIDRWDGIVPVVVGEWSVGLQGNVYDGLDSASNIMIGKAYAAAQLNVFEEGFGHFFWSYKLDTNSHKEWDFKRMVELGYFPDDFSTQ